MKKLCYVLVGIMILTFVVLPCFSCSKDNEITTGGACSISDLNSLYDKNTVKVKVNTTDRVDSLLPPVGFPYGTEQDGLYSKNCRLGVCIPRLILYTSN